MSICERLALPLEALVWFMGRHQALPHLDPSPPPHHLDPSAPYPHLDPSTPSPLSPPPRGDKQLVGLQTMHRNAICG